MLLPCLHSGLHFKEINLKRMDPQYLCCVLWEVLTRDFKLNLREIVAETTPFKVDNAIDQVAVRAR